MGIIVSTVKGCGKRTLLSSLDHGIVGVDCGDINEDTNIDIYIDSALSLSETCDFVFISSSSKLRKRLNERGIDFDLFYPSADRRKEIIEGMVRAKERPSVIAEFDKHFERIVESIEDDEMEHEKKHKLSKHGEYIGNNTLIKQYIISLQQ